MALEEYRRKRDFQKTPEPAGGDRKPVGQPANAGRRPAADEAGVEDMSVSLSHEGDYATAVVITTREKP